MASTRKKQDEKNLKLLREMVGLPHNKYCFDCNQRGPTYVNVTIGSFVCTKCSGMLRGLTPPHRVKSISMATFSPEEVELLQYRGNDYCRKVWLGLHDSKFNLNTREESQVRDFMVDKYERKRYYLEPSSVNFNAIKPSEKVPEVKPLSALINQPKNLHINGYTPANNNQQKNEFVADFNSADIYNSTTNFNNNIKPVAFANFDNNPIFTTNASWWNFDPFQQNWDIATYSEKQKVSHHPPPNFAPAEDKYAALKDLDNALKGQQTLDWSGDSSSSLYSSPSSSLYSSPSQETNNVSNPFSNGQIWSSPAQTQTAAFVVNPFKSSTEQEFSSFNFNTNKTSPANPFMIGSSSNSCSNNPFL